MARLTCPTARHAGRRGPARSRPTAAPPSPTATGAELVELEGAGHCPNAPPPGAVQPAAARLRRRAPTSRPAPPGAWRRAIRRRQARAVRLLADRPRPRVARRRDRARAARAAPRRSRSTGSRRTPVTRVLEALRRAHPPGEPRSSRTSRATSPPSRASTSSTSSRRGAGWTRSCSPTSCSSTTSRREEPYDLWIGDEAWELDYYLHENPELKTAAVRLPDRLRRLAADGRGRGGGGAADRRLQRRDDRADRALPARARPRDLRRQRPRTSCRTRSAPACPRSARGSRTTSTSPATSLGPSGEPDDREALRAELGYAPDERVCIVTVGGSGVGGGLLERVIAAFPEARRRVPGLRMVVVCGPRIDPDVARRARGRRGPRLRPRPLAPPRRVRRRRRPGRPRPPAWSWPPRGRPFVYFPLRRHFEQNLHVRHRLERYGAGRAMDYRDRHAGVHRRRDRRARSASRRAPAAVERDGAARAAAPSPTRSTRHPDRHRRTSRHGEPERVRLP